MSARSFSVSGGVRQPLGRHAHARPRTDRSATHDLRGNVVARGHDPQLDRPVGQQHPVPCSEVRCQRRIRHASRRSCRRRTDHPGAKGERRAGLERQRTASSSPRRIFGPDRSARSPTGRPAVRGHVTNASRRRREERWIAMREVEPGNVHPGRDEFVDPILGRRSERADELRAAPPARTLGRLSPDSVAVRVTDAGVRVAALASRCGG